MLRQLYFCSLESIAKSECAKLISFPTLLCHFWHFGLESPDKCEHKMNLLRFALKMQGNSIVCLSPVTKECFSLKPRLGELCPAPFTMHSLFCFVLFGLLLELSTEAKLFIILLPNNCSQSTCSLISPHRALGVERTFLPREN